jgi:SAM-dependent methyltransferase
MIFDILKKYLPAGNSFYAVEPNPANIQRLIKKDVIIFQDLNNIGDGLKFDLVFLCNVLEHIPNPVPFLSKIVSHLKTGGYLYIEVPERDDTFKLFLEPHVTVYTTQNLRALTEKTGLAQIHLAGFGKRRGDIIAENNRPWMLRKISGGIMLLKYVLFRYTDRDVLNAMYKLTEEGEDRWWIRGIFQKRRKEWE